MLQNTLKFEWIADDANSKYVLFLVSGRDLVC